MKNYPESFVECTRPVPFRPRWRVSFQLPNSFTPRFVSLHASTHGQADVDIVVIPILLPVENLAHEAKVTERPSRVQGVQFLQEHAPGGLVVVLKELRDILGILAGLDCADDAKPITGGNRLGEERLAGIIHALFELVLELLVKLDADKERIAIIGGRLLCCED